jgi:hypothetical protein
MPHRRSPAIAGHLSATADRLGFADFTGEPMKHLPPGFVIPAQSIAVLRLPSWSAWVNEIQHNGRSSATVLRRGSDRERKRPEARLTLRLARSFSTVRGRLRLDRTMSQNQISAWLAGSPPDWVADLISLSLRHALCWSMCCGRRFRGIRMVKLQVGDLPSEGRGRVFEHAGRVNLIKRLCRIGLSSAKARLTINSPIKVSIGV